MNCPTTSNGSCSWMDEKSFHRAVRTIFWVILHHHDPYPWALDRCLATMALLRAIWEYSVTVAHAGYWLEFLSSGLFVMEPAGGDAGERWPQWGSRGGLHACTGDSAGLHPIQIQPGHQLHQSGRLQVRYGGRLRTRSHAQGWGGLTWKAICQWKYLLL